MISASTMSATEKKKIHPHKFTLWIGIGSIIMMFAGLTSAVIVKRNQADWQSYRIPSIFWVSTVVILLSSLTVQWALKEFKEREMRKYRMLMTLTGILGIVFIVLQWFGFKELWDQQGIHLTNSVSGSFLYIIFGLHGLHVLGGIIALIILFMKAYSVRTRTYSAVPVEIVSVYWHFVDLLWLYLLVFFILIQ